MHNSEHYMDHRASHIIHYLIQLLRKMAELIPMLQALMVANNDIRRSAEESFQSGLNADPLMVVNSLLSIGVQADIDPVIRTMAAVLLRRILETHMEKFPSPDSLRIREQVYICWNQESIPHVRRKFAHLLAQIASQTSWADLVPGILNSSSNPESVLHLLEILSEYIPEEVANSAASYWPYLSNTISSTNPAIKVASAKATAACVATIDDEDALKAFQGVVLPILNVLNEILSRCEESDATVLMDRLIDVAQFKPTFFKPTFEAVLQAMMAIGSHKDLEFSTRSAAMEMLVTLSESAPAMARRSKGFIDQMVDLVMNLMLEVDDDQAQFQRERYNQENEDDCVDAEDAMERLALGLGGKSVCDTVLQRVQQYSQNSDWRCRRASLAALYRLAEGASKYFEKYLPSVTPFILTSLQDASVRVQYEALQCIGRLCQTYPEKCTSFIASFIAPAAAMLQNPAYCDRIRGHAASAMINMLNPDHCDADAIDKVIDPLLQAVLMALTNAHNEIRAPALTIIGKVAQICPEGFAPYYEQIMPGVKDILMHATSKDLLPLRGKAMECAGLIGEAVGVSRFATDAREIMQIFMHAMYLDADSDVTFEYLLPACSRMAKALGQDFMEYITPIFQLLIVGAKQELQFSAEEAGEDDVAGEVTFDEDTNTESTVVEVTAGVKLRMSLNTHAAQQKKQAAKLLLEFAESMGASLCTWLLPAMEALMHIMQEKFCPSEVKANAASGLARMYESLLKAVAQGQGAQVLVNNQTAVTLQSVFETCLECTATVIKKEHDMVARNAQAESIRDVLQASFEAGILEVDGTRQSGFPVTFSQELTMILVSSVLVLAAEAVYKRNQALESLEGKAEVLDEEDAGEVQDLVAQEEDLLGVLVDILGHLIKLQGESFMKIFDDVIAPAFSSYLAPGQPASMQAIAVCLIDDAIEYGGVSAHKYLPSVAPLLLLASQSEDTILVQSSLYGLAVACKMAPASMVQFLAPLLSCFVSTILRPGAGDDEGLAITENAVFGLSSILSNPAYASTLQQTQGDFPIPELSKLWMKKMPLRLDGMEVQSSLLQLCEVVERWDEQVLGPQASWVLTDLLRVFAEIAQAVAKESAGLEEQNDRDNVLGSVHRQTLQRLQVCLRRMQQADSSTGLGDAVQRTFGSLAAHLQAALQAFSQ